MRFDRRRIVLAYAVLAGACDTATGVLLVTVPAATLRLMAIPAIPGEAVYLRFIGAFVGGIGLTYLAPFAASRGSAAIAGRLAHVLVTTAIVRGCVAAFVAGAVLAGALVPAWLSVCATDLAFALFQAYVVRRRWLA